ncbi:MAG: hypothetical protein ACLQOO_11645 [Terriglobia bacterium]
MEKDEVAKVESRKSEVKSKNDRFLASFDSQLSTLDFLIAIATARIGNVEHRVIGSNLPKNRLKIAVTD